MRELTFRGYLTRYVRQLSKQNTLSITKLAEEATSDNPRLAEPLMLYALICGKQDALIKATASDLRYTAILQNQSADSIMEHLRKHSPTLPDEFHKVWSSYQSVKNRYKADEHTKQLMRKKILRMQAAYGITNYRIYSALEINPGNLNAWLKHDLGKKVGLDTARAALHYVEAQANDYNLK